MKNIFRWIFILFCMLILNNSTASAGCFPDYSVYKNHENKIVYFPIEWFNREIIEGPIFKINELVLLDIDSTCWGIDITDEKRFTLFDLNNDSKIKYIINFLLILIIHFTPIILFAYIIFRKTNYLLLRTFIFFIPFFIWVIYIIWKFFLYSFIS